MLWGILEGTVLGPLLFVICINDIITNLTKSTTIRLFADDNLLYREIRNKEDTTVLQKDLDTLQKGEENMDNGIQIQQMPNISGNK